MLLCSFGFAIKKTSRGLEGSGGEGGGDEGLKVEGGFTFGRLQGGFKGRDRFLSLLFMIGFVNSEGEPVGEADFLRLQAKERIKAHVKVIGSCLKDTTRMTSHGVSSTNMNKTAKRVLRILSTCSLLEIADGYEVDGMSPSPEALGLWSYVFRAMILAICLAIGSGFLAGRNSFGRRNPVRDAEVQEPQEVPFQDD